MPLKSLPQVLCADSVSIPKRDAIFAAFGGAEIHVFLGVVPDGLVAAEFGDRRRHDLVAAVDQLTDSFRREAGFELHIAAVGFRRLAGGFGRTDVVNPRCVARLLQAHVEVEQVHENLHVALRLHVAAHDAEAHHRAAVLGDQRGNDRVERPLPGGVGVRTAGREVEQFAAVLQAEPEPRAGKRPSRSRGSCSG